MRLVIASNNQHKITEIKAILGDCFDEIISLKEAQIDIDVLEDGKTFEANAKKKAEEVLNVASDVDAVLSDDSGLAVDALGGAPGVYSARYAGSGHDDNANNAKLLQEMRKFTTDEERTCRFVSAVALARKGLPTLVEIGIVDGILLHEPVGNFGFGYDPLFFYPPFNKSFAEMNADEKNLVSHRKNALEAMRRALTSK